MRTTVECGTCNNFGSGSCYALGADADHECCHNPNYNPPVETQDELDQEIVTQDYFSFLDELAADEEDEQAEMEALADDWAMEQYDRTVGDDEELQDLDIDFIDAIDEDEDVELIDMTFAFIDLR